MDPRSKTANVVVTGIPDLDRSYPSGRGRYGFYLNAIFDGVTNWMLDVGTVRAAWGAPNSVERLHKLINAAAGAQEVVTVEGVEIGNETHWSGERLRTIRPVHVYIGGEEWHRAAPRQSASVSG